MPDSTRVAILVMAAGSGQRAGPGLPKQYRPILGIPLLRRTIANLRAGIPEAHLQVVISPEHQAIFEETTAGLDLRSPVLGGATRQESVLRGLSAIASDAPDIVLIHDAARPFAERDVIDTLIAHLQAGNVQGVAPGLLVQDTVKRCSADGLVQSTIDRIGLWRVQTPQAFLFPAILDAHRAASGAADATDDLAIAERAGLEVAVIPGSDAAFKITTADDFVAAELHILSALPDVRTGSGFDVHAFGRGDHVTLCGIEVPHSQSLLGHSDADVGLHAVTDAILGAIGAGDIGSHFPPSDAQWRGADSARFLRRAAALVAQRGGAIAHVDVTLICEAPKIGPHRAAMVGRMEDILGIPGRVSVKATTTEGLGFTGRREGIAAQAVATVRLP